MREALEQFLQELAAHPRNSPHTLAAYRRDVTRVLDRAAGPGRPLAAERWNLPENHVADSDEASRF